LVSETSPPLEVDTENCSEWPPATEEAVDGEPLLQPSRASSKVLLKIVCELAPPLPEKSEQPLSPALQVVLSEVRAL